MRTALSDTRCISPVPDIIIPKTISTSNPNATSDFRSCPTEVAVPLVIDTTQIQTRIRTDSGVVMSSDSSPEPQLKVDEINLSSEATSVSCQTFVTGANDDIANEITSSKREGGQLPDPVTNLRYSARLADLLCHGLLDTKKIYEMYCERNPLAGEEEKTECSTANSSLGNYEPSMEAPAEVDIKPPAASKNKNERLIALLDMYEKQDMLSKDFADDMASKVKDSSVGNANLEIFPTELFGFKKRKKRHSRSLNETKIHQRAALSATPSVNEVTSSCSNVKYSCDTTIENENRLDGNRASRAITEVPDVTVVDGGSFMPKDLCSTRVLTSRVLTAPSRATYTTTYI